MGSSAPVMLSLCDTSGVMVRPWLKAKYECWTVDLNHEAGVHQDSGGIFRVGADVRSWRPPPEIAARVAFVAAFPPCTDMAVSGARHFKGKGLRRLAGAIETFASCVEIIEATSAPGFCENPVSTISTYYRPPDYTFNPCDYGDPYNKLTCLWAFNGFRMPPKRPVEPTEGSKMHFLPPTADRAALRSLTPEGFARAVFRANGERPLDAMARLLAEVTG